MSELKGIDVSQHQGKINWKKAKADGVQFAMLRAGIGDNIKPQDDKQFTRNVNQCEKYGIPWGAYLYSYAGSNKEVKSEIKHMRRLLKGKKPAFPVAFDMEDADGYKKKNGMPKKKQLVTFSKKFLNAMEKDGHYASLYASRSWLNSKLNSKRLNKFDKWVADWNGKDQSTYKGDHQLWQYTNKGNVDGVGNAIDMNIAYYDFEGSGASKKVKTHKVQSGDTLGEIAQKYSVSMKKILKANPDIKNADSIQAGDNLKIPK